MNYIIFKFIINSNFKPILDASSFLKNWIAYSKPFEWFDLPVDVSADNESMKSKSSLLQFI